MFKSNHSARKNQRVSVERWIIRLCGLVCGGVSIVAAFRNGQLIGSTPFDGLMFGAAGVAIVAMSWFLPTLAAEAWANKARVKAFAATVLWIVTASFTLVQAVGYSAHHRTETVEGNREAQRQSGDAKRHLDAAVAELQAMKANTRWEATAGCTNATAEKSKAFCEAVTAKASEISGARAAAGRDTPGSVDAQAEALAWATGLNANWIAAAMPIIMAIVFELGAGLSFFVAHPGETAETSVAPKAKPRKKAKRKAKKTDWTKPDAYASPAKLDGRTRAARAMKKRASVPANAN